MLPIELREYVDERSKSPFRKWFADLDNVALTRTRIALARLVQGNTSGVKSIGAGVNELKIDFGPGYRVYFGWEGKSVVLLLGGGSKARQQRDIEAAKERWHDHKHGKGNWRTLDA